jgi:hypothetical protein
MWAFKRLHRIKVKIAAMATGARPFQSAEADMALTQLAGL